VPKGGRSVANTLFNSKTPISLGFSVAERVKIVVFRRE